MADKKIFILITLRERELLVDESISIEQEALSCLRITEVVGDKIRFSILPKDLDSLLDGLAADANHAASKKTQGELDRLYAHLQKHLDMHGGNVRMQDPMAGTSLEKIVEKYKAQANEDDDPMVEQAVYGFEPKTLVEYLNEPKKALGGLTQKQVVELLRDGWWKTKSPIRLNTELALTDFADSRFLNNARIFLELLQQDGGALLTAKGNLTRKFVAQMVERMDFAPGYKEKLFEFNKVINEMDVEPLHSLRLICTLVKLTRKNKKRLVPTKQGIRLLDKKNAGQLFAELFHAQFAELNLSYLDPLPEDENTLQDFFPYSLYRLSLLDVGKEYPISDLTSVLLPPSLAKDLDAAFQWLDTETILQSRILFPLHEFGLVTLSPNTSEEISESRNCLQKTALFERFIKTT